MRLLLVRKSLMKGDGNEIVNNVPRLEKQAGQKGV
jgi:hypothetical protein